jgi:phosphatidylglycerol---prolipoprotein diacylglyceryl transferase
MPPVAAIRIPDTGAAPEWIWIAALVAALLWVIRAGRGEGLDPRKVYLVGVAALIGGLVGARLVGVAVHGEGADLFAWLSVWSGARSWYGGLLLGPLAALVMVRRTGGRALAFADAGAPAVALGYAIGRFGCLLNGDDYGKLSSLPWAVTYPAGTEAHAAQLAQGWLAPSAAQSLPVHPVQLYASVAGVGIFLILRRGRSFRPGERMCLLAVLYGASRFLLEFLRGDFLPAGAGLSQPQACSIALLLAGCGAWLAAFRRRPAEAAA